MTYENLDGKVIIVNDNNKINLLNELSSLNKLINVKIITLSEFKKKYFFDYDKETVHYICKKESCLYEIAKIYLNNLYYIDETKEYSNKKINFLKDLKLNLIDKKLIRQNPLFKNYLKQKEIVAFNLAYEDKFYLNIFKSLNVTFFDNKLKSNKAKLYKFSNMEEEISFVASKIVKLIKEGIDINKIKLANIKDDYIYEVNKIFKLFNIPINGLTKEKASGTNIVKSFIKNFSNNIEETINIINELAKTDKEKKLVKKIINIVNEYNFTSNLNEVKDLILEDVNNISMEGTLLANAVEVIDFTSSEINDDKYVFLINFNQGSMPTDYKDEDYLNDKEKEILGINTSIENNKSIHEKLKNKIKNTSHLFVTYSENNSTGEIYISSLYEKDLFDEEKPVNTYKYSDLYNKILLTNKLDEFYKFGTKTDDLLNLYAHYNLTDYNTFDNKFKGINEDDFNKSIEKGLTISYSSLSDFYNCQFKYYIKHILKLEKYEQTFFTTIGNIYHYCLSKCFDKDFDFDSSFEKALTMYEYEYKKSELFFLDILKEELKTVIKIVQKQRSNSYFLKGFYERRIIVPLDEKRNIILKGFIDKLILCKNDVESYFIIDYKTGDASNNLNNLYYGLDMQLPIYVYLASKVPELQNIKLGGFYLQKIISNKQDIEDKEKDLMLNGYTNSDVSIIKLLDKNFENSKTIKGIKTLKDGSLSKSAKVLSDKEIESIKNLAENKVIEAYKLILDRKFSINPKKVSNELIGCKYCTFKDICYRKNEDIVELEEKKYTDFLGGEQND